AGGAIQVAGLGDEVLALELHQRVVLLELVEVVPVGGGGLAVEQPRLGDEAHTGAHRRDGRAPQVLGLQPGGVIGVAADGAARVAPLAGHVHQVELGSLLQGGGGGEGEAGGGAGRFPPGAEGEDIQLRRRGVQSAAGGLGGFQHLDGQGGAGGQNVVAQENADAAGGGGHGQCPRTEFGWIVELYDRKSHQVNPATCLH